MSAADGKTERLWSLDALRGFDMLFISGLGGIVYELAILIFGGVISLLPAAYTGLLTNFAILTVAWLFLWFLYRKDVFLRV